MPLTKMEHFLVLTDDIDKTRTFYCEALGLKVGHRPPLEFAGYWLYLGDVPCLHIGEWESYTAHSRQLGIPVTSPAPGTGPVDHIAFNGANYEDIRARLENQGVPFSLNIVPENGLWQLFLSDPNGVKIEINIPAS
jgi:catechol 2,3-dioxygenase-like lactoylglutathione lyase family enzyme